MLKTFENVLSFASFGHEIDTTLLNEFLAQTNRLLLPKIVGDRLHIFRVRDVNTQLAFNPLGIPEPNPLFCAEVEISDLQVILVPALCFDQHNHRLGYGRGFYDRLLSSVPHALTIGIGFKEQHMITLPKERTDVALERVFLF